MNNTKDGIHTTTNPNGNGWVNTANGVVLTRHRVKRTAIASGQRIARHHGQPYTVHRADGTVIATRSYEVSPVAP